ncbi:MAG: Alpha-mannosidase [Anaerophaga sp.]|nr:Alpha-mannosidase [Anaerophaga sp.]
MKRVNVFLLSAICICASVSLKVTAREKGEPVTVTKKSEKVREDTIHVIGHAHMDMNWLWTYFETMKMCNDNLRQAVAFMDEFPDYTMIQSQAAVYKFVERVDPPLFKRIQEDVKAGRLELGGGMWTEGDTNLSSGEALARSFLLGQRYFNQHFGKTAKVGWLPDNFGHTSQLPQMLKLAGIDYYYFHRCKPYLGSFWWEGPDGSKVLCYANDTYNGTITPNLSDELNRFAPDKHRILQVTGVGDHGGGPTRKDIEMVHELDSKSDYPAVKFTTAEYFFDRLSQEMEGRPTHKGEMQFIFEGCYTTVSETKSGNRNCESLLYGSEFFNTLRWLSGDKYPHDQLNDLWETVTFNQFHDILPGSAIYESNRQTAARYAETERKAREMKGEAFLKMADEVKFQEGMGQPVVAYNLFPVKHKTLVEATVYSQEEPATIKAASWGENYYGKNFKPVSEDGLATVLVRDETGKSYPAQIVFSKSTPPGYTSKVQFIDENFPAGGYKTYYIDMAKKGVNATPIKINDNTFETDFFIVKFDMNKGAITSLFDKRSHTEYVKEGGELNKLRIYLEDKKGGMKSWSINKIVKEEDVTNVESVKIIEKGPVRACVETVKTWGKSRFIERTYLYKSYPRIDYDMEIHWLEIGTDSTDSPMLRALFPLNIQNPRFYCQVPFNVVERPIDGMINGEKAPSWLTSQSNIYGVTPETYDGQEVPAQRWVDVTDGTKGIALLNKTKYGHSYHNGDLRLTLMRSAGNPDIYPNLGKFTVSYALYPHAGDWTNGVWQEGDDFNVPVLAAEPPSLALGKAHATRPESDSFISLDADGVHMTGIKKAEDTEALVIRLVEVEGKEKEFSLTLPKNVQTVREINFIEMPIADPMPITVRENAVTAKINPHQILTLAITFK